MDKAWPHEMAKSLHKAKTPKAELVGRGEFLSKSWTVSRPLSLHTLPGVSLFLC
jgi:hypothetical protein